MSSNNDKRKIFADVTNVDSSIESQSKKPKPTEFLDMMPILSGLDHQPVVTILSSMFVQNRHPGLAMFKQDLKTDKMSFEDLQRLCDYNNESGLITFLTYALQPSEQNKVPSKQCALIIGMRVFLFLDGGT